MKFNFLDWTIIVAYLLGMLLLGFIFSKKNKTADDYILGGRNMSPIMIGISLFATLFSTLSYLSYPGEMIKYGPIFLAGILAFPLASWIVGKYLIPKFLEMNVKSAYEILEIKVGKGTRNLAVIFFLSLRFLWMTTIIYATVDIALIPIFGIDQSLAPLISIILSLLTVVYTSMGGLKAVVITDVLQSIIMFLGLILTIIFVLHEVGSTEVFFDTSLYTHWQPIRFKIDPAQRMTIGNIFIMTLTWQVCTAGSDQMAIQRYLSTNNIKEAKKSYNISLIGSTVIQILLGITGICVILYFTIHSDLMIENTTIFDAADRLFPLFIRVGLPSGLTGLIASAIMAAAMSSFSSGLNSCSAVILEDIIKHKRKIVNNQNSDLKLIKRISIIIGLAVVVFSFFISNVKGNLFDVIQKVVNLIVSPLFVLFFMALFVSFSTNRGTMLGGIISLISAILIAFFEIFGLKSLWIMPISLIAGVTFGIIFSYIEHKIFKNK